MTATPKEVAIEIGEQYVNDYPTVPSPGQKRDRLEKAFERMAYANRDLFEQIPVPVEFQEEDPYGDYWDMRNTVAREGILRVYSGHPDHPFWSDRENLISRAVHDWHGHLTVNCNFSPSGEYLKWEHSRDHYPRYCERVFFTEVVGQVGAVHYLPDGFEDPEYEQKVFAAPPEWIERMSRAVQAHTD